MNSKLTTADIVDLFAQKSGLDKREAEIFVKEFFQSISNVISKGESLTIDGIGDFKHIWVAERKSVNINTGEPHIIKGHYKVVFSPDKSLKDAVNAPFASFVTEVIPQIVDAVEAETLNPKSEEVVVDATSSTTDKEATTITPVQVVIDSEVVHQQTVPNEPAQPEEVEQPQKQEQYVETEESITTPIVADNSIDINEEDIDEEDIAAIERRRGYRKGFATAAIIFVVISLALLFFLNIEISVLNNIFNKNKNEIPVVVVDTIVAPIDTIAVGVDTATAKDIPATDTIGRGKYLTTIAQKHYGDKIFWVYIYRYNQDRIWDPRDLPVGFKVNLPPLTKYDIDPNSSESIAKAKAIEEEILLEIQ